MRRAARTDANHSEIMEAFRAIGFSVADTSRLGNGYPDLNIARANRSALVEIKDGKKPKSQRALTAAECEFKKNWKGVYLIVESLDDVVNVGRNWTRTVTA